MTNKFDHKSLSLESNKKIVFTALSKKLFYFRMFICQFVLEKGYVPINPFMSFDYFVADLVDRDLVRGANNTLLARSDELWVFGGISNGVLAEIKIAKELKKTIKYFAIKNDKDIIGISKDEAILEDDIKEFKSEL